MTTRQAVRPTRKDAGETSPETKRMRWLLGIAAALAVLCLIVWFPSWRTYPAVTSKESLSLMKLLYTACNTRDPVRLDKVERGIGEAAQAGKLSPAEVEAFGKIVTMAKGGDWATAERASFKFAQDQVGQGSDKLTPHDHDHDHGKKPAKRKVATRQ